MANVFQSFSDILNPISEETFWNEYYQKKPLFIKGHKDKAQGLMPWPSLNRLLNQTRIWDGTALQLSLNKQPIAPQQYCDIEAALTGQVLRPSPKKVTSFLNQGATLICNDIDSLTPELKNISSLLEKELHGKSQANLYCSWQQKPGFDVHFDTHDVFAFHTEGQKVWRIYDGKVENPVAHPYYKNLPTNYHEQHKGSYEEITMEPGDFVYIPRGFYHEALASSTYSIHVTFGLTYLMGHDILNLLTETINEWPALRETLPHPKEGQKAMSKYCQNLSKFLKEQLTNQDFQNSIQNFQSEYGYSRDGYNLPQDIESPSYKISSDDFEVAKHQGFWVLKNKHNNKAVPIPNDYETPIQWILKQKQFQKEEFYNAFTQLQDNAKDKLLNDLSQMRVIEAA